jgi:hypothetical protein
VTTPDDLSAHRTRTNMPRPTPHPDTVREIEQVYDAIEDRT